MTVHDRVPSKWALLIGSSYENLPGTDNDVATIADVLQNYGFDVENESYVKKLCGNEATRENILGAWGELISKASWGDAVFIYYSGHGGLAKPTGPDASRQRPKHIQFLVPTDFNVNSEDWTGIMDDELSEWLLKTTGKTPNVTYILDCCHSARLGREPRGSNALPKRSVFKYDILLKHRTRLREEKKLLENEFWTNPDVVRVAAAAELEAAWQYQNSAGEHVGILTEKLALMMKESSGQMSWRNIMLGTKALVEREFNGDRDIQQPRSAGADTRIPFSLERRASKALLAVVGDKHTTIQGGLVHGVREGDVYILIPFKIQKQADATTVHTVRSQKATIVRARGFTATASDVSKKNFPFSEAMALPYSRNHRWPVAVTENLPHVNALLDKSNFFRRCRSTETPIVEFVREGGESKGIALYGGGRQVKLASDQQDDALTIEKLFSIAHTFSEAQFLFSLEGGEKDEHLEPKMSIEIGVIKEYKEDPRLRYSNQSRSDPEPKALSFTMTDEYYIRLDLQAEEGGQENGVSVNTFRIDASGRTILVSKPWTKGMHLYGGHRSDMLWIDPDGIPFEWPRSVPRVGSLKEHFVFVITMKPIDLRSFEISSPEDYLLARGDSPTAATNSTNSYSIVCIPYELQWSDAADEDSPSQRQIAGSDLPAPEDIEKLGEGSSSQHGVSEAEPKGWMGGVVRTLQGIPKSVTVINQHDEEITVVVSQFSPNYDLTSVGLNGSATGAGFNLSATTWRSPSPKKVLAPQARDPNSSMATFPFWTRKDGFGVISIFKGPEDMLFIENDRVPMGAVVYFQGRPELKIVEFQAKN